MLIPKENQRDLKEIPARVKRKLRLEFVENMDQVLQKALVLDDPRLLEHPAEYALSEIFDVGGETAVN